MTVQSDDTKGQPIANLEHGPDWTDWQEGDDGDSCKCGFNGTSQECARSRTRTFPAPTKQENT
jgi:hypothetical protein